MTNKEKNIVYSIMIDLINHNISLQDAFKRLEELEK